MRHTVRKPDTCLNAGPILGHLASRKGTVGTCHGSWLAQFSDTVAFAHSREVASDPHVFRPFCFEASCVPAFSSLQMPDSFSSTQDSVACCTPVAMYFVGKWGVIFGIHDPLAIDSGRESCRTQPKALAVLGSQEPSPLAHESFKAAGDPSQDQAKVTAGIDLRRWHRNCQ